MRTALVLVGAIALVAAGRMLAPPATPEAPRVEPEAAPAREAIRLPQPEPAVVPQPAPAQQPMQAPSGGCGQ